MKKYFCNRVTPATRLYRMIEYIEKGDIRNIIDLHENHGAYEHFVTKLNFRLSMIAATHGQLECLKYLHSVGHPMIGMFCAVNNGHFNCADYFHSNGCELEPFYFNHAIKKESLELLEWLHEKKCPYNSDVIKNEVISPKCLSWLNSKNYTI